MLGPWLPWGGLCVTGMARAAVTVSLGTSQLSLGTGTGCQGGSSEDLHQSQSGLLIRVWEGKGPVGQSSFLGWAGLSHFTGEKPWHSGE